MELANLSNVVSNIKHDVESVFNEINNSLYTENAQDTPLVPISISSGGGNEEELANLRSEFRKYAEQIEKFQLDLMDQDSSRR